MIIGLLMQKEDKKQSMADFVGECLLYYTKKYAQKPDSCYVHPERVDELKSITSVNIIPAKNISRINAWIGREDNLVLDKI